MLWVAGGAVGLGFMRRPLFFDLRGLFAVTGGAEGTGHVGRVFESRRLVRRVTTQAVGVAHALGVRLVAVEAGEMFAVSLVAFLAVHGGMLAGHRLQGGTNRGMAGETGRLDRIEGIQIDGQRAVRRVALGAAANGEMRIIRRRMAGTAGDSGRDTGFGMTGVAVGATDPRMPPMTVGAADRGTVGAAPFVDIGHL
jgi:hypothetical protein